MPSQPLIKSRVGQQVCVAVAMGAMLLLSLLLVWVVTGASWSLPGPGQGSVLGVSTAPESLGIQPQEGSVTVDTLPFVLPAGWKPVEGRQIEAFGSSPQIVIEDSARPSRWVRFAQVRTQERIKPDDFIRGVAELMWSDTKQDPIRRVMLQQAGTIYGATWFLVPSDEAADGVGDLDLFAVITPDDRQFWVLHLRDTITSRAEGEAIIVQDTRLIEQFYHQALAQAASPHASPTEPR